jgi:hypothetical protein
MEEGLGVRSAEGATERWQSRGRTWDERLQLFCDCVLCPPLLVLGAQDGRRAADATGPEGVGESGKVTEKGVRSRQAVNDVA